MEGKRNKVEYQPRLPEYAFSVREIQANLFSAYLKGAYSDPFTGSKTLLSKVVPGARKILGPRLIVEWLEFSLSTTATKPVLDENLKKEILAFRPGDASREVVLEDFLSLAQRIKEWLGEHLFLSDAVFLDQQSAEHLREGSEKLNELVYCKHFPKEHALDLYLASARTLSPMERLRFFHEGMEKTREYIRREKAKGYRIEVIRATSWIVSASPESVERFGFHILKDGEGHPTNACEFLVDDAWLNQGAKR
jgi:hypothetical protein